MNKHACEIPQFQDTGKKMKPDAFPMQFGAQVVTDDMKKSSKASWQKMIVSRQFRNQGRC